MKKMKNIQALMETKALKRNNYAISKVNNINQTFSRNLIFQTITNI